MTSSPTPPFTDFTDLAGYVAVPRVTSLAVSPDGGRVVVAVQEPDRHGSRYRSALWELDPSGDAAPRRLTFSDKGESAPRFGPDGALYFTSARPDPLGEDGDDGQAAVWVLPERGEPRPVASGSAALSLAGVATDGTLLTTTSVLAGGELADDAQRRAERRQRKVSAILHTGMPVRYWDHEVGDVSPRAVLARPDADAGGDPLAVRELTDLTPGADTVALLNAALDLSADGTVVATTWRTRAPHGDSNESVVLFESDPAHPGRKPKRRTLIRARGGDGYGGLHLSPDASRLALVRATPSSPTDTNYLRLEIHPVAAGDDAGPVLAELGDLTPGGMVWAPDGTTLYVTGDLHSRGAVLAIDAATGRARTVADDAVYSSLQITADGTHLYALRSTIEEPNRPVRLTARRAGEPLRIDAPGAIGALPGRVEWVTTSVDSGEGEVEVGAWLCVPDGASTAEPAPLMVWIHGGPHGSYNAWSWRWCPWLAVARGYAVLMPDPAMSTGYGDAGLNRGWPRTASVVWREVEALADLVLRRRTLDAERTALLGASFGGFMTNWVAGQTERFKAIVTHAGLYALDQQHTTTDAAAGKTRVHQRPADAPDWYAANSPHHAVDRITTPMLLTHGTRDYRVPVSEALRLWFDLVDGWTGKPADLPHRYLELTSENHWVLSPANGRVWNQVVLDFCDHHVLGRGDLPEVLPHWGDGDDERP